MREVTLDIDAVRTYLSDQTRAQTFPALVATANRLIEHADDADALTDFGAALLAFVGTVSDLPLAWREDVAVVIDAAAPALRPHVYSAHALIAVVVALYENLGLSSRHHWLTPDPLAKRLALTAMQERFRARHGAMLVTTT